MRYLVDVGALIPVNGVTAADALTLALLDLGCESHVDHRAAVYELSQDGQSLIRVIPCEWSEREGAAT